MEFEKAMKSFVDAIRNAYTKAVTSRVDNLITFS
jgi:hypothetical protein